MPIRVLVVDDDDRFRFVVRAVLRRADGVEIVGEAANGREAIELAEGDAEPDVVLLDLLMPVMDGFAALPELRRLVPDASIIVLTALDEGQADREHALVGADAFLEKRHLGDLLVPLVLEQSAGTLPTTPT